MISIYNFINEKLKLNAQSKLQKRWSIKDAKKGDIITAQDGDVTLAFVFKDIFNTTEFGDVVGISAYYYFDVEHNCGITKEHDESNVGPVEDYLNDTIKAWPSTDEEKNEMFKYMRLEGYKWNENKKEFEEV